MTLRLAITPGEPSGIGPDILVKTVQHGCEHELVAFADPDLLIQRAEQLGLPLHLREFEAASAACSLAKGELAVAPIKLLAPATAGQLDKRNAPYVLDCLEQALESCTNKTCNGMVTGPVQKSVINDSGFNFSGHTEYLAEKTDTPTVVMMLACESMRVALATTHVPLRDVADSINKQQLIRIIEIVHRDLTDKFAIQKPKILVCGLNPHAGEAGHLGREEIQIIEPAIEHLQKEGIDVVGPLAADTLFTDKYLRTADAVLAMYHDQGLPVLKYAGFGQAANITLGLPIIRTSVDHGTALDLAGTGQANHSSLESAMIAAATMALLSQGSQA